MQELHIAKISIDNALGLIVAPESTSNGYKHVYRAAMSVRWDEEHRAFHVIAPDLDLLSAYKQILAAVAAEYGERLKPSEGTVWVDVPEGLKSSIKGLAGE